MMATTRLLIVLYVLVSLHSTFSFSLAPARCVHPTSTCLFSEEESSAGEAPAEEAAAAMNNEAPVIATDILNSPAFLQRKLQVLQSDIAQMDADAEAARQQLEEGKAEWGSQLEALQTEYQNIQERMNNQSKKGDSMATVQVAREVLKVLDTSDRAFGVINAETDEQKAIELEYRAAYNQILQILADLDVEEVITLGTEFDYEVHQAVMQKPSEDYEEGVVCEELQKGFKLGETLIRAAMVVVAA